MSHGASGRPVAGPETPGGPAAGRMLYRAWIAVLIAGLVGFALYTSFIGVFPTLQQRAVHLGLGMALVFTLNPSPGRGRWPRVLDGFLAGTSLLVAAYVFVEYQSLPQRMGIPTPADVWLGAVALLLVLEGARRVASSWLSILGLVAVAYAFLGQFLPLPLGHTGVSYQRLLSYIYTTTDGIFGEPLGASATYIVVFLILGAMLQATGGGEFFLELSQAVFGRVRGGAAKIAVVASSLFGSISGSAIANAATTGAITVPMMVRSGFRKEFAGAVEAVSSTGGQIMPPIMGASAFIMAEILNISYLEVVKAALVPALLYYAAVFMIVDLEAVKFKLVGMPDLPKLGSVMRKGGVFLIPLLLLLYLLIAKGMTPLLAGAWATLTVVLVAPFNRYKRVRPIDFWAGCKAAAEGTLVVMGATAAAGVLIGVISLTSLGFKISSFLVSVSGGSLITLLILTMIASFVLGIGLPTVATYIVLATLVAPALAGLGIKPLTAHMFVFYYGIFADMTPPVAVTAYTAASFAGADPNKTGWYASWLGMCAYLVPFVFVYSPALLLQGSLETILIAVLTALAGVWLLAISLQGYAFGTLHLWERVVLAIAAVALMVRHPVAELAAGGVALVIVIRHFMATRLVRSSLGERYQQPYKSEGGISGE